jgi:hypothetical protein
MYSLCQPYSLEAVPDDAAVCTLLNFICITKGAYQHRNSKDISTLFIDLTF